MTSEPKSPKPNKPRRRAVLPDPPGVDPHPESQDDEATDTESGPNDQRLREDKPPHY